MLKNNLHIYYGHVQGSSSAIRSGSRPVIRKIRLLLFPCTRSDIGRLADDLERGLDGRLELLIVINLKQCVEILI